MSFYHVAKNALLSRGKRLYVRKGQLIQVDVALLMLDAWAGGPILDKVLTGDNHGILRTKLPTKKYR